MIKKLAVAGALAMAQMLAFGPAAEAQTVLRFGWWGSPTADSNAATFEWGRQIEAATEGRVRIDFLASPPGSPVSFYDLISEGVIDAGYYAPGITQGRFVLHEAAEFPFLGASAEANSAAYWRTYQEHFAAAQEHGGVVVVTVVTHGPGMLHNSRRAVTRAGDIAGLKLRVPGATIGQLSDTLGATAMFVPFTEVTQVISSGIADGLFVPYNAVRDLSLGRYLRHTTHVPGGLYNLVFHYAINRDTWESISEADRAAIMAVSGEAGARLIGRAWDNGDRLGRAYVEAEGVTITEMGPEFQAEIAAAFEPMRADWVARAGALGVDAEAALAFLRAEVARLNAEIE